jgi:hypothetical protein
MDSGYFFLFLHSLLRYGVLITVFLAGAKSLLGLVMDKPILTWERLVTIIAMILCHVQLLVGLILYAMNVKFYTPDHPAYIFWKFEHITTMILGIALVTIGRMLSKRAQEERLKQKRIALFYLIALVLFLWATPWPFREIGHGRGWL